MSKEIKIDLKPQQIKVIDSSRLPLALRQQEQKKLQKGIIKQMLATFGKKS